MTECSLRCFLRKYEVGTKLDEEDLTNLVRKYDRDVDQGWSFREFMKCLQPLLQYHQKAKDLHKVSLRGSGHTLTSAVPPEREGSLFKENIRPTFSKGTKSTDITSPHSQKLLLSEPNYSRGNIRHQESASGDGYSAYMASASGLNQNEAIMNYPYSFDQASPQDLQDKLFQERIQQNTAYNKLQSPMLN